MRGPGITAALAVLLAAAPADAETIGVIALAGPEPPAARAELARTAAKAAPTTVAGVLAVAAANLRDGAVPRVELDRFTQVKAQVDQAWQAFLEVQPDDAHERLAKALVEAEALLPLAGGTELYADIALRLGAVLDYLGRKPEAGDAIRVALVLDPDRELSPREFSPDVLAAVDAARAVTPSTRTVHLTATNPGRVAVALEVDGVAHGTAPVTLDLALGLHIAIARAPGHVARALAFSVTAGVAGATADHALDLDPAPDAAAIAGGLDAGAADDRASSAVEAALRYGEVDAIVLVATAWRRGEPALLAQRCAGVPVRCTKIEEIGYGTATGLAAAVRSALDELARTPATLVVPTLPGDRRLGERRHLPRCITCSPWVWAGAGAIAIAATVITVVATSSKTTKVVFGVPGFPPAAMRHWP